MTIDNLWQPFRSVFIFIMKGVLNRSAAGRP